VRQSLVGSEWFRVQSLGKERQTIESKPVPGTVADMLLINIQPASAFHDDSEMKVSSDSTVVVYRSISSTCIHRVALLYDTQLILRNLSATRHFRRRTCGIIARRAFCLKTSSDYVTNALIRAALYS